MYKMMFWPKETAPTKRIDDCLKLMNSLEKQFQVTNGILQTPTQPIETTSYSIRHFTIHIPISPNEKKISIIVSTPDKEKGEISAQIGVNMFIFSDTNRYESIKFDIPLSNVKWDAVFKEIVYGWLRIVNVIELEVKKKNTNLTISTTPDAGVRHVLNAELRVYPNRGRFIQIQLSETPVDANYNFSMYLNLGRGHYHMNYINFAQFGTRLSRYMTEPIPSNPFGVCYEQQHQRLVGMTFDTPSF